MPKSFRENAWKATAKLLCCTVFLIGLGICLMPAGIFAMKDSMAADPAAAQNGEAPGEIETPPLILADSSILMEADYGYGGMAKGSRYVPVRISLVNQEDQAFEGNLQILSMETDHVIYSYNYPVTLAGAEEKKESFNIPLGTRADQLYVILKDQSGREVMRKRLKLNISLDAAELLIGILSDTPEQLTYLDGVGINYSMVRTRTAELSTDLMPEEETGLDLLDVILITNYDAGDLSAAQKSAVMGWVRKGGVLLLGTGNRVHDVLGPFADGIVEEPYGIPTMMAVDMGVEYATNGPGDSFITVPSVDIALHNGDVILSNDELPILTAVTEEQGKIAVAAYDFVDIAPFCQVQRSYVEKIFQNLLGEEQINQLANAMYNGRTDQYWSIQNVINTGDVDKLPNIILYGVVILVYLILIGPLVYLVLKRRDKGRYYRSTVTMLSLVFAGIIYVMGNKTRFKDTFFNYATIRDITAESITDTTVLNMRTPYNKPYSVELDPEYSVRPITKSYYYDMAMVPKFTGTEEPKVLINYGALETDIQIRDVVAFNPQYFILEKKSENEDQLGLTGNITMFDGKIFGTVSNHYTTPIEKAVVMMYGQMVILDTINPGETKTLDGLPVLNYPVNNSYVVAGRVSGSDQYEKADISDKDYVNSVEQSNLLVYYIDNYMGSYFPDAKIIGFSPKKEEVPFLKNQNYQNYGSTLVTSDVSVNTTKDDQIFRYAFAKKPKVMSGGYTADTNTMFGIDPLILEYSLGNDLQIDKVSFHLLSEDFTNNEKYDYLVPFTGSMYFYNYNTSSYDSMDLAKRDFNSERLAPYLSPSNTLTVKYVPEKTSEYNWNIMLPMLTVVGRGK